MASRIISEDSKTKEEAARRFIVERTVVVEYAQHNEYNPETEKFDKPVDEASLIWRTDTDTYSVEATQTLENLILVEGKLLIYDETELDMIIQLLNDVKVANVFEKK